MPARRIFLLISSLLIVFGFWLWQSPQPALAAPTCRAMNLNNNNNLIATNEYYDFWAGSFANTVGNYKVYFRFEGSDLALSPGKQDWTQDIFCLGCPTLPCTPNNSPNRCAAGAYYTKTGCYQAEVKVVDDSGEAICGIDVFDVCNVSTPSDTSVNLSYSNDGNDGNDLTQESRIVGSSYICGAAFDIVDWDANWGGNSMSTPAQAYLSFPPSANTFPSYLWSGYDCFASTCGGGWGGDFATAFGAINFRYSGQFPKSFIWKLNTGPCLPGIACLYDFIVMPGQTITSGVSIRNLYYRNDSPSCVSSPSCLFSACEEVQYQKSDGTWSKDDFSVSPGQTVKLRCNSSVGTIDKWTWAAQLPSSKKIFYEGYSAKTTPLAYNYDLTDQASRYEPFTAPAAPTGATGWLVDKIYTKVSWNTGTTGLYAQIFNSAGQGLWGDNQVLFQASGSQEEKIIALDVGLGDLVEYPVLSGQNYKLALKVPASSQVAYWWNSSCCNYNNYYQLYLRPDIQGVFNPADKNNREISWTAPLGDQLTPGQTFTLLTHPHNTCGWGWGDEIKATVGDFGNLIVEYYEDSLNGDMLNCSPSVPLMATVGGRTMTCNTAGVLAGKLQIALSPNTYTVNPLLAADYTVAQWQYNGGNVNTTTAISVEVVGGGVTRVLKIAVDKEAVAWFQTKDGDVHAAGNLTSSIPDNYTYPNFSLIGTGGFPGVISLIGNSNFGYGYPSLSTANHWLAKTTLPGHFYDYYFTLLGSPAVDNFIDEDSITGDGGVYLQNESFSLTSRDWSFPADCKAVLFIDGEFEIGKKITVPVGSFLAVIVKGDIKIKGVVGDKVGAQAEAPDIEGIYVADGSIKTNYDEDMSGNRLVVAGSMIAQVFDLKRDLKAIGGNFSAPAELFVSRPDFYINAYPGLMKLEHTWQEISP